MKTIIWIVVGTIIITGALLIGFGLMTLPEYANLLLDGVKSAAELANK